MNEMEAVLARHSVRAYTGEPIKAEIAGELNALISEINEEYNLHIQLRENTDRIFDGIVAKVCGWKFVPNYLAMVGPNDDKTTELMGWVGEKIVLKAQALGLNTCWAGMYKKKNLKAQILPGEKNHLVIAIGYGQSNGGPRPSKSYNDVAEASVDAPQWFKDGVECALLAPTAMNQQKFKFHLAADESVIMSTDNGPFSRLDMGIARYHFELASGHKVML